jgi:hypothetical protein
MSDLSEQDLEDLELDDARRYGHISRVAEIEGRRWKRMKERAEKAELRVQQLAGELQETKECLIDAIVRAEKAELLQISVDNLIRLAKDPWPRDETDPWKRGWNQAMEAVLRKLGAE